MQQPIAGGSLDGTKRGALPALAAGLVRSGLVSDDRLREVLAGKDPSKSLVRALLETKEVDDAALASFLSRRYGTPLADLSDHPIDRSSARLLPRSVARRCLAIPLEVGSEQAVVAMVDPTDVVARDDIRSILRKDLRLVVSSYSQVIAEIDRAQLDLQDEFDRTAGNFDGHADDDSASDVLEEGPIISLVNQTISRAILDRASDIHIEPVARGVRIRFRIDGVLHEIGYLPKSVQPQVLTRIKILAGLDISERRRPQDGRFTISIDANRVDLRVATLPTYLGEKVVIRVLDTGGTRLDLADLGFLPEIRASYDRLTEKPWGMILVTGPTGSGKSTTLYATLSRLNRVESNIITVEDPVEYQLDGISQIQVNALAGVTFASALRSILRADPDIMLIGEIRDRETAEIAIEAALTGHLVLSSLHTNDSLSTPSRLSEMGVEPYLIASALTGVVGQRLARKLCDRCRISITLETGWLVDAGFNLPEGVGGEIQAYRASAKGCERCSHTGYFGRLAFQELLEVSEPLERAIADRATNDRLKEIAIAEGFLALRDVALRHVLRGVTSVEEVLRVLV